MAVSPQTVEESRKTVEQFDLSFDVLTDAGNHVARKYGLVYQFPEGLREVYRQLGLDLPEFNGDDSWTLPMPARYVVEAGGVVRWASVSPDYTKRPDPSKTLEALEGPTAGG